jgi:hypothetical protein
MTRRAFQLKEVEKQPGYGWATERYLRRLVAERRIPFHKPTFKVMIDLTDLDIYLERGRIEPRGTVSRMVSSKGGRRQPEPAEEVGRD